MQYYSLKIIPLIILFKFKLETIWKEKKTVPNNECGEIDQLFSWSIV